MKVRPIFAILTRPIVNRFRLMLLVANLLLTALASLASAQQPVERSIGDSLRSLASRASFAFVGQVSRIDCHAGFVDVTFSVEQQVLGQVGQTYHLRQWAGLWTGGQQPFRVGERAMVFLHAPGPSGLSSTVDGDEGIVPIVSARASQAAASASESVLADLRRLSTRLQRAPGEQAQVAGNAMAVPAAVMVVSEWRKGQVPEQTLSQLPVSVAATPGVSLALR